MAQVISIPSLIIVIDIKTLIIFADIANDLQASQFETLKGPEDYQTILGKFV